MNPRAIKAGILSTHYMVNRWSRGDPGGAHHDSLGHTQLLHRPGSCQYAGISDQSDQTWLCPCTKRWAYTNRLAGTNQLVLYIIGGMSVCFYVCMKPKGFLTTAPIVTIFGMDHLWDLSSSLMGSWNRSINHQSHKSIIQSIISPYLLNYCSDFDHFWHGSSLGP